MASEIRNRFTDTEMQIARETDLPELLSHLGYHRIEGNEAAGHVAGTQLGSKKYMNMKHLEAAMDDAFIAG